MDELTGSIDSSFGYVCQTQYQYPCVASINAIPPSFHLLRAAIRWDALTQQTHQRSFFLL